MSNLTSNSSNIGLFELGLIGAGLLGLGVLGLSGRSKQQACCQDHSKLAGSNSLEASRINFQNSKLGSLMVINDIESIRNQDVYLENLKKLMKNNIQWSKQIITTHPDFFDKLKNIQTPEYLWIGCSDSRVPANQIVGLKPGELFVHRNIANQAPLSDINSLAVIQYAVEYLKVKDIIVCGHYGCGGVRAAFKKEDHGPLESWLSYIRNLRARYRKQFGKGSQKEDEDLLVELNVKQNVENIARVPTVQKAWKEGRQLRIHGLVYRLQDGILHDLGIKITSLEDLPEANRIY